MQDEKFETKLARALDRSLVLTDAARQAEINRVAEERLRALVHITSRRRRVRARARFAWFCLFIFLAVVLIAIFMLLDGKRTDGLVTIMLSLVPLIGGGWHLQRANAEEIGWARELERLGVADVEP
jgi:hypothetical protein